LHAVVLSIHFNLPQTLLKEFTPPSLDVVLVNTKSHTRPSKADVLAQANVDGGGNVDENRRAKSPLPVTASEHHGDALKEAQQRVQQLEAQQRALLSQIKAAPTQTPSTPAPSTEPAPQPTPSGQDLVASAMQRLKLEAEISRNVDEYNKRPQKLFIGARATEYAAAMYLDDWVRKVERVGNLNYPEMARGKFYGGVQFQVTLRPDGSVYSFELLRPSGYSVLDRAAESIVRMAAPYPAISAKVLAGHDLLVLTRTMMFLRGDRLTSGTD
jgi:protein TonB